MIPYDDLVVALANWRSKQGLVSATPAPVAAASGPVPSPGSGPTAASGKSGSGPKTAPPGPAPSSGPSKKPPQPAPAPALQVSEGSISVDETIFEGEDDYGMALDNLEAVDEATSIGQAPVRDSFGGQTDPLPNPTGSPRPPGNRNDDW